MIGQTIKAKGRPTLRVTAADAGAWIAERVNEFGSPVRLTADDMRAYGIEPPHEVDPETALREADDKRTREVTEAYFKANSDNRGHETAHVIGERKPRRAKDAPGFTPEQVFEAAGAYGDAARTVAERILADPLKLAAVDAGHVGVHADVWRALEALRAADE